MLHALPLVRYVQEKGAGGGTLVRWVLVNNRNRRK